MKFRKKPVVIEAYRYTADSCLDICAWASIEHEGGFEPQTCGVDMLVIETLEGPMRADPGDWIIRGVAGEFYPCKPDVFVATYEPADEPPRASEPKKP